MSQEITKLNSCHAPTRTRVAMSANLASLFEAHKPIKPQFEVVKATKWKAAKGESEEQVKPREKPASTKKRRREADPRESRTVFVGNIPISLPKKRLKQLFKKYGTVESVRFRSMTIGEGDLPARIARKTHKQLGGNSLNAYVVFGSEEEAEKSLALNGTGVEGRHLRVDLAHRTKEHEHRRSVFVGNLPFSADEEALRAAFEGCGDVEAVRIVRDTKTGVGKGFGFVLFAERSSVVFALKQNRKLEVDGRSLRVFKSRDMSQSELGASKYPGHLQQPRFAGIQAKEPSKWKARRAKGRLRGKTGLRKKGVESKTSQPRFAGIQAKEPIANAKRRLRQKTGLKKKGAESKKSQFAGSQAKQPSKLKTKGKRRLEEKIGLKKNGVESKTSQQQPRSVAKKPSKSLQKGKALKKKAQTSKQ